MTAFWGDVWVYVSRVKFFSARDWGVYAIWVGMMFGLLACVSGFLFVGWSNGVEYPPYVWNVPIGTATFIIAIAFDTIGHRTVYKEELKKGEALVHHITIAAGVSSVILLCLAYGHRSFFHFPALVMVFLSVFYSMIDEAMHWRRYLHGHSDRVEMWSHFFIFVGHLLMIVSWYYWFLDEYPGVRQTLVYLNQR